MAVPVMRIREMCVAVFQRLVPMPVAVAGARRHGLGMRVIMVRIAGTVHMAMAVLQRLMAVGMHMALAEVQRHAERHQGGSQRQRHCHRLAQH
jgi:hypothetical protein